MRFRFCGELEPPDWLLAEIPLVTTTLNAKDQVTELCEAICVDIQDFDHHKTTLREGPLGIALDVLDDDAHARAAVRVLLFILSHAAKYDVKHQELLLELQQLGFHADLASSITTVYQAKRSQLRERLLDTSLHLSPKLLDVDWQVDLVLESKSISQVNRPVVQLQLQTDSQQSEQRVVTCEADARKFRSLYRELQQTLALVDTFVAQQQDREDP